MKTPVTPDDNTTKPDQSRALTITQRLKDPEFLAKLAAALPRHLTKERYARTVLTAISKNPKLRDCTQDSVMTAIVTAAQLGLEIDGRHGHLVPFRNEGRLEAQFIPDWKGLVQLVLRSGLVKSIHLDVVRDADVFQYDRGELVRHTIDFRKPRGETYAAYSLVRMNDGSESVCVMGRDDIEEIRNRTKKSDKKSPWDTDWNEMAKKTVFKRHVKSLSISADFRDAEELASKEDEEALDVTPKSDAEKAGFRRPQNTPRQLPESDPFPPEEESGTTEVPPMTIVVDAEPAPESKPAAAPGPAAKPNRDPSPVVDAQAESAFADPPPALAAQIERQQSSRQATPAAQAQAPAPVARQASKHPVEAFVTKAGFTLGEASSILVEEQFIEHPITDWSQIPESVTKKLCASQVGFLGMMGRRRAAGGAM